MPDTQYQTCRSCGKTKPLCDGFHVASQNKTGYSRRCKDCDREYQREYRFGNRGKINSRAQAKRDKFKSLAIDRLGGVCATCGGVFDPCVYDFHHTDPSKKDFTISERMSINLEDFLKEVDKCILLCANCHRMEHDKNG